MNYIFKSILFYYFFYCVFTYWGEAGTTSHTPRIFQLPLTRTDSTCGTDINHPSPKAENLFAAVFINTLGWLCDCNSSNNRKK